MSPIDEESLAELGAQPAQFGQPGPAPLLVQMSRGYLWVGALACLASAALLLVAQPLHGAVFAALYGALALVALACTRVPDAALPHALTALLVALALLLLATALVPGWGLATPGLPITGLMVCALCSAAGWRAGALLAAVAAAVVGAVALLAAPAAGGALPPLAAQLGTHLIAIAAGLACGVMISQVLARYMRSANEREHRFKRLLALAADAYWEIDAGYRLVVAAEHAADHAAEPGGAPPTRGSGAVPWELPQFGCDPDTLDRLLADLGSRVPFRDLPARWTTSAGTVRSLLLSGEPRFDERGVFAGYWGVARDVSAVHSAREALAATETRYQELFSRIPTPLVLHREGRVIDANPSALALFGHDALAPMLGSELIDSYASGDSRERGRRRMEALQSQPTGTALPVADFRLYAAGREVSVRASSVRVDTQGGPALLTIYIDDTDRLAAEDAVRRSEALLSHLVATSPDVITLTELASGRYAMVNHSFERVSGWSAAEAVGRTAAEIGIWGRDGQRERFVARLQREGVVTDMAAHFVTRAGKTVPMVVSAARFAMDRREYIVVNARDVTERERQRVEREAILANASIGIAVTRQQRFVLANPHFEQIYGWGSGELVGLPGSVVWCSAADYAEVGAAAGPALASGEPVEMERTAQRKDGSTFTARIRGRAIDAAAPGHAIQPGRPDGATIWIVEDVTERRAFEQALARARDDAESANRAKSAFLANTSHELRTPLNALIGLARLARDEALDGERRRQYLDRIAQSAQSLAAIISDILDLSKIEAGKLLVEAAPFELTTELHALERSYAPLAAAHGLELRCRLAPGLAGSVSGDALRLRQIVANFLTNAIKFTASGYVGLAARRLAAPHAGTVRIEVQDSGPGIDEATAQRLFKPFTQADQSTTRRFGGTGLGLSICRELATLMGGSVGVASHAEAGAGAGSTFWLELPLPPAEWAPLPAGHAPAPSSEASGSLAGLHVLLVEDNSVNMLIAAAMLERWGVQVTQAHDGREAIAAVQHTAGAGRPFDVVLMDLQMPVMSGVEATQALRVAGHGVPIIALTAAALVTERDAALRSGMDDFLTKPIDADRLHAALQRWRRPEGDFTPEG